MTYLEHTVICHECKQSMKNGLLIEQLLLNILIIFRVPSSWILNKISVYFFEVETPPLVFKLDPAISSTGSECFCLKISISFSQICTMPYETRSLPKNL